jgi:hypothetical protein
MKLESRIGNKSVYSEFIGGRTVRASTFNGEAGAKIIFDIYRKTNGVGRGVPIAQELATTPLRR